MTSSVRLNKYLANQGIASRRTIDKMITAGRIKLNGHPVKLGDTLNPSKDEVTVDDQPITNTQNNSALEYYLINKPLGIISTTNDPHHRQTILSLVNSKTRLYPVGRLDKDSHGLILLTNDGLLTQQLTHPSSHIPKTYRVVLAGQFTDAKLKKLQTGVKLKDGLSAPAQVNVLETRPRRTVINLTLIEGRNRQIRRMATVLKLEVVDLKRISLGPITLGDLKPGASRRLTPKELSSLTKLN